MDRPGREILVDEKQRTAERAALKNVRGVLDRMSEEEIARRRSLRRVIAFVAALVAVGAVLLAGLLWR
jgi:hypothetical protein